MGLDLSISLLSVGCLCLHIMSYNLLTQMQKVHYRYVTHLYVMSVGSVRLHDYKRRPKCPKLTNTCTPTHIYVHRYGCCCFHAYIHTYIWKCVCACSSSQVCVMCNSFSTSTFVYTTTKAELETWLCLLGLASMLVMYSYVCGRRPKVLWHCFTIAVTLFVIIVNCNCCCCYWQ